MGVTIAHLSDTHIDADERSAERAGRVLRYLASLQVPVDVVVVTGDVADHGLAAEYERIRGLVNLPMPVLFCPGNHDVREPFRASLLGGAPVNQVHRVAGALFAMCDSSVPGRDDGLIAGETLDWLDAELADAADLPAFVCLHHPPVPVGVPYVDRIRLLDAPLLAEVVGRHENVVALLCGHAHTPAASTFAGRPLIVAPGVVSTFRLPFEGGTVVDLELPPMLALHLLDDERRLTTHYRVVPGEPFG
jgi:3',5'-cyclic AMP phosphodiesterase CpdA